MSLITSSIGQGLLWSILALGVFLTFRILNFPDMTVEGTFPLGAVVTVSALTHGVSPLFATLFALFAGCLSGLVTGVLYTKLKIPILLAGILTMTALYSINLRILGKATVGLLDISTIFSYFDYLTPNFQLVFLGIAITTLVVFAIVLFLNTELGQAFIATGDNQKIAHSLGINTDAMKILGLMLGNGLVGLSGGLLAQNNGYADVSMGIGTIVIGLAAIIIGEVLYGPLSLSARLVAVVCGSILYRLVLLAVLQLGFNTNDFKLISTIILTLCLSLPTLEQKFKIRQTFSKGSSKQ